MTPPQPTISLEHGPVPDGPTGSSPPAAQVAFVGGGEQARRFQQAAIDLGIDLVVITPYERGTDHGGLDRPRVSTAGILDDLLALTAPNAVVTLGDDSLRHAYLEAAAVAGRTVRPNAATRRVTTDPLAARRLLSECGFDLAPFKEIDARDARAVVRFAQRHGWPVRLSTARREQTSSNVHIVRPFTVLDHVWASSTERRWLIEACEPTAPELTVTVVRRPSGQRIVYPVIATTPDGGASLLMDAATETRARSIATAIVDGLDATGVITVALVCSRDGRLVVDDVTQGPFLRTVSTFDADTSLFADHLRGILDMHLDPADRILGRA